jgi:hypothetical protein
MVMKTGYQKKNNSSPQLGSAYDLVIADLFSKLKKMKEGMIKLGSLGNLHKKQRIIRSALNGRTYAYYQVSFKSSSILKKELDK